jgi:hypothetical protein
MRHTTRTTIPAPEWGSRQTVADGTTYAVVGIGNGQWVLRANGTDLGYPTTRELAESGFRALTEDA